MANPFLTDPSTLLQIMPTRKTRKRITTHTLLFCAGIIVYVVGWGDPASLLHKAALEYAFILAGTIAMGYSMSAVADNYTVYKSDVGVIIPNENYAVPEVDKGP